MTKIDFLIGNNYTFSHLADKFNKYYESIQELIKLDDLTIADKIKVAPSVHHGLIQHYYNEKSLLKKYEKALILFEEQKLKEFGSTTKLKYETMKMVEKDEKYRELKEKSIIQEELVLYLKDCLQLFKTLSYDFKNVTDMLKLETI